MVTMEYLLAFLENILLKLCDFIQMTMTTAFDNSIFYIVKDAHKNRCSISLTCLLSLI